MLSKQNSSNNDSGTMILTPKEIGVNNYSKCTVIIRSFNFIAILLGNHQNEGFEAFPSDFWTSELWLLIAQTILFPSSMGFNMGEIETLQQLPRQLEQLLTALKLSLTPFHLQKLKQTILDSLCSSWATSIWQPTFSILDNCTNILEYIHLLDGLKLLHKTGFLKEILTEEDHCQLLLNSMKSFVENKNDQLIANILTPLQQLLCQKMLEVALVSELAENMISKIILDDEIILSSMGEIYSARGELFFAIFSKQLSHLIIAKQDFFIPQICLQISENKQVLSMITIIVDQLIQERQWRKQYGKAFVRSLLLQFCKFNEGSYTASQQALLLKLFIIDSKTVIDSSEPYFSFIFEMYLKSLKNIQLSQLSQGYLLDMLPFFSTVNEECSHQLKIALEDFSIRNFPLDSSEFLYGSTKYNEYINAIKKILNALELTGSLMLLEFIMSIVCREKQHIYEAEIEKSLIVFIKRLNSFCQKKAVDVAYTVFVSDNSFSCEIQLAAIEHFAVLLLQNSNHAAIEAFYCKHIVDIMTKIQAKMLKNSLKIQLISKIGNLILIECMYRCLAKEDIASQNSEINLRYCNGKAVTGKELTQEITRCSHLIRKENTQGETELMDLRGRLHCVAHNALIAIISCTQTDPRFYTMFLFTENTSKGDYLWDNLVDKNKNYHFEIEQDVFYKKKKYFVSIRHNICQKEDSNLNTDDARVSLDSIHYITTQYLSQSSLSEDVSQYDFTYAAKFSAFTDGKDSLDLVKRRKIDNESSPEANPFELEQDGLNEHECMGPITVLIKHLKIMGIIPPWKRGLDLPKEMPPWMVGMHKKMDDSHGNVKLFIAKIVMNNYEIFEPYARFWLKPLMQLIVSKEAGEFINTFVIDLMVVILSWASVAIPQDNAVERSLASQVLQFLIMNTGHHRRYILRNNLEMIKTVVEVWKSRIDIPTRVIYENLNNFNSDNNVVGIQLLAIVLANGLPPYSHFSECDQKTFLSALAKNLTMNQTVIYAASAEVIGMTLNYLSTVSKSEEDAFQDVVCEILQQMLEKSCDKFLKVLSKMQKHYSAIGQRFITKLLYILPQLHGIFQHFCLEAIVYHAKEIKDVFNQLKTINILQLLTSGHEGIQLTSLRIINEILDLLKPEELHYLLPTLMSLAKSANAACRKIVYDISMWLYDTFGKNDTADFQKIYFLAKNTLLQGFGDNELNLRMMITNFLSEENRLPSAIIDRAISLLDVLYSPAAEHHFLSQATFLLLEKTSQSPDFNRKIFSRPLSECSFVNYNINTSWCSRHSTIMPMFVDSLTFQFSSFDPEEFDNQLRVTPGTSDFSATQDKQTVTTGKVFNWLTQTSVDILSSTLSHETAAEQSSLLFTLTKNVPHYHKHSSGRVFPSVGPNFGERHPISPVKETEVNNDISYDRNLKLLKRRFLKEKDTGESKKKFARQTLLNQSQLEKNEVLQLKKKQGQVTLYRNYRKGDLPDIEINYSALIVPLQVLAQKDDAIAQILFSNLFCGILHEMEHIRQQKDIEDTYSSLSTYFSKILEETTTFSPSFLAAILEIAFHHCQKIKLSFDHLTNACIVSNLQNNGILLVEEYLRQSNEVESVVELPKKKARFSHSKKPKNLEVWLKLAELYKSVQNFDMVRAIFDMNFGSRKLNRSALEAEARNDYYTACRLYSEAMECSNKSEGQFLEAEYDYWDDALMKCFNCLTQWDQLEQHTLNSFTEKDNRELMHIWEENYYQDHYLSFMIRSKLKLFIDGRNDQSLLNFFDETMADQKHPHRFALLQTHYAVELALIYLLQDDYDRAAHYNNIALENFLQEWVILSEQATTVRQLKLQNLKKMSDLHLFFISANHQDKKNHITFLQTLNEWEKCLPAPLDSVSVWDDVIVNRCLCIDHLKKLLEPNGKKGDIERKFELASERTKFHLNLRYVESMLKQNNLTVALKILKKTHLMAKSLNDNCLTLDWTHSYVNAHLKRCEVQQIKEKLSTIFGAWRQLDKISKFEELSRDSYLLCRHHLLQSRLTQHLAVAFEEDGKLIDQLEEKEKDLLKIYFTADNSKLSELVPNLFEMTFNQSCNAIRSCTGETASSITTDAYLHLAFFCDQLLRKTEEKEESDEQPAFVNKLPSILVETLFQAMKLESRSARQNFPRLLQIVEIYPETVPLFQVKASLVPPWMFLKWTNQLVALLDKPEASAIQNIVCSLVDLYPQALVYPFKLSQSGFYFVSTPESRQKQKIVDRIQSTLAKHHLVNEFISALDLLSNVDALFLDKCLSISKLLSAAKPDEHLIRDMCNEFISELCNPNKCQGKYRMMMAKEFGQQVEALFGKDGSKVMKCSLQEFNTNYKKVGDAMKKFSQSHMSLQLKEYSDWFHNFNSVNNDEELEIPGQYTGDKKPLLEHHVKVAGFDQQLLSLRSLRMPKRITIRGSDERDHRFLVKGGEDLRLDQRIQQLFDIMNGIYAKDSVCAPLKLNLTTYQVIPLTLRLGLVQWIDGTSTLLEFLLSSLTGEEILGMKSAENEHYNWVMKSSPKSKGNYQQIFSTYRREDTVQHYQKLLSYIPHDLLRRGLLQMGSTLESFLVLRNAFIVSHAVLSISHYVLGIGDRHLSNFMVSLDEGRVIGIDFGHSFGTATQFLPVPELMPFRLTNQFVRLMEPLSKGGLLQATMVHALAALRSSPHLLLNTMDIFIKEPSLDWLEFAHRQAKIGQVAAEDPADVSWYPKQKISVAKKKLNGWNSCHITKEELTLGHQKSKVIKELVNVCLGSSEFNIRSQMPINNLSAEQQVECLIDHATDENILGRTWGGWNPWM